MSLIKELFAKPPPCPPDLKLQRHLDRWQCQPWHVKILRFKHYLSIPSATIKSYLKSFNIGHGLTLYQAYSINKESAQGPMKWYYTMSEVSTHLNERH